MQMAHANVNKKWVQARLRSLAKTQRQLAKLLGVSPPAVTHMLNGTQKVKGKQLSILANELQISLGRALELFDLDDDRNVMFRIPIKGYVDAAAGSVVLRTDVEMGHLEFIDSPFPGYEGCVVRIKGDSMTPRYKDGEVIAFTPNHGDIAAFINKEVIAETTDGRLLFKLLHKGSRPFVFTLTSINPAEPPLVDVELTWAAVLDWHIPRRV